MNFVRLPAPRAANSDAAHYKNQGHEGETSIQGTYLSVMNTEKFSSFFNPSSTTTATPAIPLSVKMHLLVCIPSLPFVLFLSVCGRLF